MRSITLKGKKGKEALRMGGNVVGQGKKSEDEGDKRKRWEKKRKENKRGRNKPKGKTMGGVNSLR